MNATEAGRVYCGSLWCCRQNPGPEMTLRADIDTIVVVIMENRASEQRQVRPLSRDQPVTATGCIITELSQTRESETEGISMLSPYP